MTSDWYRKFHSMRQALIDGGTDEAAARAFYEGIVGHAAIVRLTVALNLAVTDGGQDWAIEVADAARLSTFLDHLEQASLDADERDHLLELIVASLDEQVRQAGEDDLLCQRVARHLLAAFERYRHLVEYWACAASPTTAGFAITPFMRRLLVSATREQRSDP